MQFDQIHSSHLESYVSDRQSGNSRDEAGRPLFVIGQQAQMDRRANCERYTIYKDFVFPVRLLGRAQSRVIQN